MLYGRYSIRLSVVQGAGIGETEIVVDSLPDRRMVVAWAIQGFSQASCNSIEHERDVPSVSDMSAWRRCVVLSIGVRRQESPATPAG